MPALLRFVFEFCLSTETEDNVTTDDTMQETEENEGADANSCVI